MKGPATLVERKRSSTPLLVHMRHTAVHPLADHATPSNVRDGAQSTDLSQVSARTESAACSATPTRCPFGGACHACPLSVQAKLAVNRPGDLYEQEANRAAEEVVQAQGLRVQRPSAGPMMPTYAPPIVHDVLRSPGRPLDPSTCAFFEPRLGHDFSGVRVHTDARAAESARAVDALAYTSGRDMVFGKEQYSPETVKGRELLAHELSHVVQQQTAPYPFIQRLSHRGCGFEPQGFPPGIIPALRIAWNLSFPRVRIAQAWFTRLGANQPVPAEVTNLLARDFMTTPTQGGRINTISDNYVRILSLLSSATYRCVTDPNSCPGLPAGGHTILGSHEPGICSNTFRVASLRDRVRIVIHETAHALDPTLGEDFYQAEGYPGMTAPQALNNADSYAAFAVHCPWPF